MIVRLQPCTQRANALLPSLLHDSAPAAFPPRTPYEAPFAFSPFYEAQLARRQAALGPGPSSTARPIYSVKAWKRRTYQKRQMHSESEYVQPNLFVYKPPIST
ncbi:hypothetical protein Y032_0048g1590 [Ancylostoma ceylanicum]|uniref:Uncharacterized protein n=1 Tax=Ancylostoma ceylanicum TaxID=53326 RepID=A0A016UAX4_9BILA|nr:hypothetical protein Y032_0048g1590 [Ancylostoma ceylanicum]